MTSTFPEPDRQYFPSLMMNSLIPVDANDTGKVALISGGSFNTPGGVSNYSIYFANLTLGIAR
jgi:hypothetical protein